MIPIPPDPRPDLHLRWRAVACLLIVGMAITWIAFMGYLIRAWWSFLHG